MAELRLNGEMNLLSTRYRVSSDCACRFKRQKWMVEVLRETSSDIGRIGLTGEKRELLQPQQLSLFQTFLPADERYSNTIDLYDAIPKYFPKKRLKKERVEGMFLPMLKREFEYKGERFVVKITPAKLETREGERDFYPSHREEIAEEAIRKIHSTSLK